MEAKNEITEKKKVNRNEFGSKDLFVKNVYKNISYLDMSKDNSKFAIQIKNDVI